MSKSVALVVVDMQNDFVSRAGKLAVPDAESIVSNVVTLIKHAVKQGWDVVCTRDEHAPEDEEFKSWPPHCLIGSTGADIVDRVMAVLPGDTIYITKHTLSAWDNPKTREVFEGKAKVFVCGVATEYCVAAFVEGCDMFSNVVVDAIAGVDEISGVPHTKGKVAHALMTIARSEMSMPVFTDEIVGEDIIAAVK